MPPLGVELNLSSRAAFDEISFADLEGADFAQQTHHQGHKVLTKIMYTVKLSCKRPSKKGYHFESQFNSVKGFPAFDFTRIRQRASQKVIYGISPHF